MGKTGKDGLSLTHKQKMFCVYYIETGNASEAYRRAYNCKRMKDETIKNKAYVLMLRDDIRATIEELQKEAADKLLISDESVLKEYACIGFADIRRIFNDNGSFKKPNELDPTSAAAISSMKVVTRNQRDGEVEYVTEIKLWPKAKALDALAKNLGLFEKHNEQKQTKSGEISGPLLEMVKLVTDRI